MGGVALLALAVAAGLAVWWFARGPSGPYAEAMGVLPEDTLRSSFTDWQQVGDEVDLPDVEAAEDPATVNEFLGEVYDADLATGSAMLDVIGGMATVYGYSPAQVEWEAYGQSRDGSVDVLRVGDDVDLDEVADNLKDAGYDAPDEDDGVWRGSADLVVQLESPMTGLQINVLLLRDEQLVLTSDSASYLEDVREVVRGDAPSLREATGTDALVAAVEGAVSAQLWSRDFACEDLAMSKADAADRNEGARLLEQAGGVHPLAGLVLARVGGDRATVAMWFESESDADDDLQPRTDLAQGPAPGQGGDFDERFTVEESVVDGQMVTMRLRAVTGTLMGDLGQGPVLFAAC